MIDVETRALALVGLAAGDALGTTLEFTTPGSFAPLTDMIGGGPFKLKPGQWTDDTSMALCLAESLIECRGFDAVDQLQRYVRWYREGITAVRASASTSATGCVLRCIGSRTPVKGGAAAPIRTQPATAR